MIVAMNSNHFDYEKNKYLNMLFYTLSIYYLIIVGCYIFLNNLYKCTLKNNKSVVLCKNSNKPSFYENTIDNQKIKSIRCFATTKSGKRCKHRVINQTEILHNIHCMNHKTK